MSMLNDFLKVAIVEDDNSYAEILYDYLKKYEQENKIKLEITRYEDGADIVEEYHGDFHIIIMDIELKFMDGMTAAQHIRQIDSDVIIIFVTNMPQFALKGYQVDALDYVLKPLSYYAFSQRLARALERMEKRSKKKYITLHLKGRIQKVNVLEITYIEALQHDLIYHMEKDGITYTVRGIIKDLEESLKEDYFFRCHKGYLINLAYVESVGEATVQLGKELIPVAKVRKKELLNAFNRYISEVSK